MIVKVQISLNTTETEPQVLIQDRKRTFFDVLPLSKCPGLEDAMADAGEARRAFFKAKLVDGRVHLNERLPEQGW